MSLPRLPGARSWFDLGSQRPSLPLLRAVRRPPVARPWSAGGNAPSAETVAQGGHPSLRVGSAR
eukprot:1331997-Pyramimonas_sp.AAC.1